MTIVVITIISTIWVISLEKSPHVTNSSPEGFEFDHIDKLFTVRYMSYEVDGVYKTTNMLIFEKAAILQTMPSIVLSNDPYEVNFYIRFNNRYFAKNTNGIFLVNNNYEAPIKLADSWDGETVPLNEKSKKDLVTFLRKLLGSGD